MNLSSGTTAVLAAAVTASLATGAQALPRIAHTSCTCTCVAYDGNGQRHEGGSYTFNTSGIGMYACDVADRVTCTVDELDGRYRSCTGTTLHQSGAAAALPSGSIQQAPVQMPMAHGLANPGATTAVPK